MTFVGLRPLITHFKHLSKNTLTPVIKSVFLGEDEAACGKMVGQGAADLANLDGGHIYDAGLKYNIVPVAAEYYGTSTGSYLLFTHRQFFRSSNLFKKIGSVFQDKLLGVTNIPCYLFPSSVFLLSK